MDVPDPDLGNKRVDSRFDPNNTFLFFTVMGEVVLARRLKLPCVRGVPSVAFIDLPGRWDVSVRANFWGHCDPAGENPALRLDKELTIARSASSKTDTRLLVDGDDDCEAEAINALEVKEMKPAQNTIHTYKTIPPVSVLSEAHDVHTLDWIKQR